MGAEEIYKGHPGANTMDNATVSLLVPMETQENNCDVSGGGVGKNFNMWMGVWLPGTICCLGIVGNFLALLVLSRDRSRSATFLSLKALSLSDMVLLICAMMQQIIPMFCIMGHRTDTFCLTQGYMRVYSWPIICMAQMTSIWLTVLISAERFIAICYPLRAQRMCTVSRIRFAVGVITFVSIVFNTPKFFEFQPVPEVDPCVNATRIVVGKAPLRTDPVYRYLYNMALYCLVIYALPLSILTVLNVKLVHKIQSARKHWQLLNRSQKREMKATKLPLCIVLVYFICGTQSLLGFILDAIFVTFFTWLQIYTAVVNLLVIFNSAVNFVLMYCFGSKFRSMLKDTLFCRKAHRKNSLSNCSQRPCSNVNGSEFG